MATKQVPPKGIVRQQAVVAQLREMILSGTAPGGQRLREIALSRQLGVSRTPIREALINLAEDGLVEYRPNRGYTVRTFTLQYILSAYATREVLESLSCRLAAEMGASPEQRDAMQTCLDEADRLLNARKFTGESLRELGKVNDAFHDLILEIARNEVLSQTMPITRNIPYLTGRVEDWQKRDLEMHHLRTIQAQHHAIYRAICARDGYSAENVMRGHIALAAEQIQRRFLEVQASTAAPHDRPSSGIKRKQSSVKRSPTALR